MSASVPPRQMLDQKKFDFNWDVLDVIIGGKSAIDTLRSFSLRTLDDANRFVHSYGYDFENPIESAEVMGNFHEALNFVRKYFLQPENPNGLKLELPRKILELSDPRELFVMASGAHASQNSEIQSTLLQQWACSLLKVMHTIAHIDKDLRTSYFSEIQKQIFDRFYKVIHRTESGQLYLGESETDPYRVDLVSFETKPKKSRESTILKLLHKPENVAEDIFDRVGIRFVTVTRLGSLRVVKYLTDKMIVVAPNIKPSRSRNTLIDLEGFKLSWAELMQESRAGHLEESALLLALKVACQPIRSSVSNPHSSEDYQAIQFTCRQLIKLRNPLYEDLKDLKSIIKQKGTSEEVSKVVERIALKHVQKEVRFFYPFEVQVVDAQSAEQNEKGRSAHSEYKKAQIQTALKRVMSGFSGVSGNP